ncbi:MAG: hypothetical protein ACD_63C00115G0003 [uncultured bacterium]|nr:MAG: hypothetical protein ACD_63C00115G0003 [uncultured bacterium]
MKPRKIALLVLLIAFLVIVGTVILYEFGDLTFIKYNAELSELDLPERFEITFAREIDKENDEARTYKIFTDGKDEEYLGKENIGRWGDAASNNSLEESMGGYVGECKFEGKELLITTGIFKTEMLINNRGERLLLERKYGLFPSLGISQVRWLPDGRHLVIVSGLSVGIYDTMNKNYAYLTDGWSVMESK